jgi:hypothetical protein
MQNIFGYPDENGFSLQPDGVLFKNLLRCADDGIFDDSRHPGVPGDQTETQSFFPTFKEVFD